MAPAQPNSSSFALPVTNSTSEPDCTARGASRHGLRGRVTVAEHEGVDGADRKPHRRLTKHRPLGVSSAKTTVANVTIDATLDG